MPRASWTPFAARAAGGPVRRGQTYLVGERGPELFKPVASGTIIPNHRASRGEPVHTVAARGGTTGPQFHVDKVEAQDVNHFLRQMQSRGRAVSGGGVSF
jgi:phage-related minor tail protein